MSKPKKIKSTYQVVKFFGQETSVLTSDNARIVQDWGYDQNADVEHFYEIGDENIVSTDYGVITTDTTVNTNVSNLSLNNLREICHVSSTSNVTQDDFDGAVVEIIVPTTEDGTNISRSLWLPDQYLTSLDINFGVDTVATENYRFSGGMDEAFLNDWKNITAEVFSSGDIAFSTNTTITTSTSSGDWGTVAYVIADGQKYANTIGTSSGYAKWTGANEITVYGVDLTSASRVAAIFAKSSGTFSTISAGASDVAGIKGEKVLAKIGYDTGTTHKWLRIQNGSISIPLNNTELKELGTKNPIDRSVEYPIEMTASVDLLESDMQEFAEMANETFGTVDNLNPELFQGRDKVKLEVEFYSDADHSSLMHKITCENLRVDGHGQSLAVRGNATERWNFTFDTITFSAS